MAHSHSGTSGGQRWARHGRLRALPGWPEESAGRLKVSPQAQANAGGGYQDQLLRVNASLGDGEGTELGGHLPRGSTSVS